MPRIPVWAALVGLFATACDDTFFPVPPEPPPVDGDGYCAVQAFFAADCFTCHAADVALGDLDLETDAAGALVGQVSARWGETLVVAGDPEGSLLYRKLTATQGAAGAEMPPASGGVSAERAALVYDWIAAGATTECSAPIVVERHHPDGYDQPVVHGPDAKFQTERCVDCHGLDLLGGTAVACVTCHGGGWTAQCNWCHGTDSTGVPPRDIDGQTDPTLISFPPHRTHITAGIGPGFDCTECHLKPIDALSDGHVFLGDPTPGEAEVRFWWGRSPVAIYDGQSCSDVYCHGNGRENGSIAKSDGPRDCDSCHQGPGGFSQLLSPPHNAHASETCAECHGDTVDAAGAIVTPAKHVDGVVQVALPVEITRTGDTCDGTCHLQPHTGAVWNP
ncbi:MAG: hypothetical protein H6737_18305 [Alphaproteobacteria bacterium]|nr:hypothetical protein [Alphaproteobacteria bacterium]